MNPDGRKAGNWNLEISFFIEIGLLLLFLGVFIFMWLESLAWPPGAALFPRIAATIGVLSVLAFGAQRVRRARNLRWVPAERILDRRLAFERGLWLWRIRGSRRGFRPGRDGRHAALRSGVRQEVSRMVFEELCHSAFLA